MVIALTKEKQAKKPGMTKLKVGQRVRVSGEVKWGDEWIRVASEGIVEEVRPRTCLVTI
jgi:hypothetical protein